jgi:hypothetical protein
MSAITLTNYRGDYMKEYLGVKLVQAEPFEKEDSEGFLISGYKIVYENGYESWSPKDVFEEAYRLITDMTFGLAVEAMKQGFRASRRGWNGKDMFVYYVPANNYKATTDIAKTEFGESVPYGAYIAMKTAQGNVVPWLASQTDMLSEDWFIYE